MGTTVTRDNKRVENPAAGLDITTLAREYISDLWSEVRQNFMASLDATTAAHKYKDRPTIGKISSGFGLSYHYLTT